MSKRLKGVPFFMAAVIGGAFLARKLSKELPKMRGRMMRRMMEGMMGKGGGPMDMCRQMLEGIGETQKLAAYATPEMRTLFEEWVKEMEASGERSRDEGGFTL